MEVDDDLETFQQQALEIRQPGDNFDPSAPPQNGEEFLMHMLYERKRCPAVVVKPPKKLVKPMVNGVKNQLEEFEVSKQKKDYFIHDLIAPFVFPAKS